MNHENSERMKFFLTEYPEAMKMLAAKHPNNNKACKPFITAKANRKPFPKQTANRYAVLEAVSNDTTGPLNPTDLHGNKYLQLLVDAGSAHLQGEAVKEKSEAPAAVHRMMSKLETLCKRKIQNLHTDGACEFSSKNFKILLSENGISSSTIPPHTSQMNAFVERRMLTVMNATRAALKAASMPLRFWSYAALDAIDKSNFLPVFRDGKLMPSPHQTLQNNGLDISAVESPDSFLPFGQIVYAVNTLATKKKLASRATEARYLRRLPNHLYQV